MGIAEDLSRLISGAKLRTGFSTFDVSISGRLVANLFARANENVWEIIVEAKEQQNV